MPEQRLTEPYAADVGNDERRNTEAEQELQWFDGLPAKLPARVQRPNTETCVYQCRAIEYDRHRRKLPESKVVPEAASHRFQRDVAEGVVEEMTEQIAEQHQSAAETNLPQADAVNPCPGWLANFRGHAIYSNCRVRRTQDSRF